MEWKGIISYLILFHKVVTVYAIRHPVFGDPLGVILPALHAYFGYFLDFTKIYLNPLSLIACLGNPCAWFPCNVVDPGIVRPMVGTPLQF